MIDHIVIDVSDAVQSRRFYEEALAPLGYRVLMAVPAEVTGGVVVLAAPIAGSSRDHASAGAVAVSDRALATRARARSFDDTRDVDPT